METNTSRMINLNGSNYQLWKTRTKDFLYVNGFHQPMICSEKPDDKTNEEWNLLHHRVCGFIRHWVDDSVLNHVSEETNARSLWSKLEQLYAPRTSNSTAGNVISEELDENNVLNEETRRTSQNCELVNKKRTFSASQVETVKHHYANGSSSLDSVYNKRKVRFRKLENPKKIEFSLELSALNNYDDVVKRVASHINLADPSKIRLTPYKRHESFSKPQPIRYRGFKHLSEILRYNKKGLHMLCYEVLDIPLPELQGLNIVNVAFHHATKDEVVKHTIRLPKESTVGDLINDLKTKVELSHKDAELRLLEISGHTIYKISPLNKKIQELIHQYRKLRAEEIPEEEKDLDAQRHLIHVHHYSKDTSQYQQVHYFGEPFLLVMREGETLAEVKMRIQKKLQVPDEDFSKWKLAFVPFYHPPYLQPVYLQDSDVLCSHFLKKNINGDSDQHLGLEHSDTTSKQSCTSNQ